MTAPATTTTNTAAAPSIVPVMGFVVKQIQALAPKEKDEEDMGKIRILLEAKSEDIRAVDRDLPAILGALNMHRMDRDPVAVQLRF